MFFSRIKRREIEHLEAVYACAHTLLLSGDIRIVGLCSTVMDS